ncbi:hypothetical protein BV22DRAFT_1133985 [Leucogyrophana mollusca]|uniref:Uncharacterized protein n=1 Tax=Leucogyrophana mollusca TaxID=85980 RepID=A0ACB8B0B6_9AGAM|nr:hypothetical protein BV22DRAFT_1133985 [Leucogyrophana mollusca]
MGVRGLWDIINKAGQSRSLANLVVIDGFEKNTSGRRAFRVGIDASIWYHRASFSKGGENPELRLLFFRLRSLAELPLLLLFIFDGRERPKVKRGSKMGKSGSHALTDDMKRLLDIFGMEWRMASAIRFFVLGEAEAELAYLNRSGVIDAIMTDDVDALVFGALRIIKKHPGVAMTRGGLIFFALLVGGDYDSGVKNVGKGAAHALAQCGFGDELLEIYHRRADQDIQPALSRWRASVNTEFHTNPRGRLRHVYPALSLPPDFPNMQLLENYANPVCSGRVGRQGGGPMRDNGELNLARAAAFCEDKFSEWGFQSAIIKRFRDLLWEAAVIRVLRRAALEADEKERTRRLERGQDATTKGPLALTVAHTIGTPPSLVKKYLDMSDTDRRRDAFVNRNSQSTQHEPHDNQRLILKVVGARQHVSTDGILEYRVEVCPSQLVDLARSGIKGKRPEPPDSAHAADDSTEPAETSPQGVKRAPKQPPPDPESIMRIWVPASMVRQVHPGLVLDFEAIEEAKKFKKSAKVGGQGIGKKRTNDSQAERGASDSSPPTSPVRPVRAHLRPTWEDSDSDDDAVLPIPSVSGIGLAEGEKRGDRYTNDNLAGPARSLAAGALPPSVPRSSGGFLFTMPNPDDPSILDLGDTDPIAVSQEDAPDLPPDRFDHLFSRVAGSESQRMGSGKSTHRQNTNVTGTPGKRTRDPATFTHLTAARDGALDNIIEGAAKRRRVTAPVHAPLVRAGNIRPRIPSDSSVPPIRGTHFNADIPDVFSDSEEDTIFQPISTSFRPAPRPFPMNSVKSSARSGPTQVSQRPSDAEPSSSQESRLFLDDAEVIIDLT